MKNFTGAVTVICIVVEIHTFTGRNNRDASYAVTTKSNLEKHLQILGKDLPKEKVITIKFMNSEYFPHHG